MTNPKVSVLTPIYNTKEEYLRGTIESILNQTFTDFEFLLLNDSPDNKHLKEIVESYHDERIVYCENKCNIGISGSRNILINLAKGEYLAVVDHDDLSRPLRLEKEVEYLDKHPNVGVVSGNIHCIYQNYDTEYPLQDLSIKTQMITGCYIAHPACMIRKSVLTTNNIKYEDEYSPSEDYMLWFRLLDKTMFANIPDILIDYRDAESNTSHLEKNKMYEKTALIRDFAVKKFPCLLKLMPTNLTNKCYYKLFHILPIYTVNRKLNKNVYKILGLPIWKTCSKANANQTKCYFCGIPFITITHK